MKKIGFVCDKLSIAQKDVLLQALSVQGEFALCDLGDICIQTQTEEEQITSQIKKIFDTITIQEIACVIGLSTSGNGIQIYANKIDGIVAIPCSSVDLVGACINELPDAIICDIPSHLSAKDIEMIATAFIKAHV